MAAHGPAWIAARLRELADHLRLRGETKFRIQAYETGANSVEALGARLEPLLAEGRLTEVSGIGDKLAATIAEIHRSGTTASLERMRGEVPAGLLAMAQLPGLNLARARLLQDELGIEGVPALEEAARLGRVRQVRGFGERSEQKLHEAIVQQKSAAPVATLLWEARPLAHSLMLHLREIRGVTRAEVAGSIRRWKEVVGTIRLVAAAPEPEAAVDAFLQAAPVGEVLTRERGRVRFRLPGGPPGDLLVVIPPLYPAALLQQTGSRAHVEELARRAQRAGWTLADATAESEAAIYARLGLPEVPPELREEDATADWDDPGADFSRLLTRADVRGFVHCHTTASDGRHDLGEMAAAARELGMEYLTITDHSPSASYAGGLPPERLAEQAAAIAALRPGLGIDILHGTESDIRADGSLDYPDEVLGRLDIIIASVHNRFKMAGEDMTRRLVTAMSQPRFKIWGHGLGRLLLRRDPIDCDVEAVLDAARAGRAAIEINGDPHRLDLAPHWLRRARRRGLKFVVSVDAHSVRDYQYVDFAVHTARRAGIRADEVLNTLPAAGFRTAVRPLSAPGTSGTTSPPRP